MKLKGKIALVTGGTTGIGAAITTKFVAEGAKVCVVSYPGEHRDELPKSLSSDTVVKCAGDVTKTADIERIVASALSLKGRIDVLVNCAGINIKGNVTDICLDDWQKTLDVNLTGPFMLMKSVIPRMIASGGGSVINIASLAGLRCPPDRAAYCTSKAALIMLTQQAALDYGQYKIRFNAVCPGLTKTSRIEQNFVQRAEEFGSEAESFLAHRTKHIPLSRYAVPSEIAGVCSFLASDDSSYMTGSILTVDGGTAIVDVLGAVAKS